VHLERRRMVMAAVEKKLVGPKPSDGAPSDHVLSIRGVPPGLYKAVRVAAATSGLGIQKYVLAALAGEVPLPSEAETAS